jgi:hypothetical protein
MKLKETLKELKEHLPFTTFASLLAIISVFFIVKMNLTNSINLLFYIFHPLHLFFSTMVSTAIFYKKGNKILFSIIMGGLISFCIGTISDVIFPYLSMNILGIKTSLHLPIIEKPFIIVLSILLGAYFSIILKITKIPHFIHVFISVFASLFYILSYVTEWRIFDLFLILIVVIFSVVIPCCLGDIVFPTLIKRKIKENYKK